MTPRDAMHDRLECEPAIGDGIVRPAFFWGWFLLAFHPMNLPHALPSLTLLIATCSVFTACASTHTGAKADPSAPKLPPVITKVEALEYVPLDPKDTEHKGPMIHVISGDLGKKGPLLFIAKLPSGFSAGWHTHTSDSYITGLKGSYHEWRRHEDEGKAVGHDGLIYMPAGVSHNNRCDDWDGPCFNLVYWPNGFDVTKE